MAVDWARSATVTDAERVFVVRGEVLMRLSCVSDASGNPGDVGEVEKFVEEAEDRSSVLGVEVGVAKYESGEFRVWG